MFLQNSIYLVELFNILHISPCCQGMNLENLFPWQPLSSQSCWYSVWLDMVIIVLHIKIYLNRWHTVAKGFWFLHRIGLKALTLLTITWLQHGQKYASPSTSSEFSFIFHWFIQQGVFYTMCFNSGNTKEKKKCWKLLRIS